MIYDVVCRNSRNTSYNTYDVLHIYRGILYDVAECGDSAVFPRGFALFRPPPHEILEPARHVFLIYYAVFCLFSEFGIEIRNKSEHN